MKIKYVSLLFSAFVLCTPHFYNDVFSMEPRNVKAAKEHTPLNSRFFREDLFLSTDTLWSVDRRMGTIKVLDSKNFSPLWSSSGIIYRSSNVNEISVKFSTSTSDSPLFDKKIEFAEISEQVFFHLSERIRMPSDSFGSTNCEYVDQILAFAPGAQGKLLWKLNANDLKQTLSIQSNDIPCFASTPLEGNGKFLLVILFLGSQTITFKIDARTGMPVLN